MRLKAAASPGTLLLGAALFVTTIIAWRSIILASTHMSAMPGMPMPATPIQFVVDWGIMMTAMMLPSAAQMILLYRTVRTRLSQQGDRAIPAAMFAIVYLMLWMLCGIPVYAGYLGVAAAASRWPAFDSAIPYIVACALIAAGEYQLTQFKRACLRKCESPLSFLMRRWKSGYRETFRMAVDHAAYCIGCCWALMVILVVAGAMSLPWVLLIALIVFAEKMSPAKWNLARYIGIGLISLGVTVMLHPDLAKTFRGGN